MEQFGCLALGAPGLRVRDPLVNSPKREMGTTGAKGRAEKKKKVTVLLFGSPPNDVRKSGTRDGTSHRETRDSLRD